MSLQHEVLYKRTSALGKLRTTTLEFSLQLTRNLEFWKQLGSLNFILFFLKKPGAVQATRGARTRTQKPMFFNSTPRDHNQSISDSNRAGSSCVPPRVLFFHWVVQSVLCVWAKINVTGKKHHNMICPFLPKTAITARMHWALQRHRNNYFLCIISPNPQNHMKAYCYCRHSQVRKRNLGRAPRVTWLAEGEAGSPGSTAASAACAQ